MAIYRVMYSSMTATYGPRFIEAEGELAAKQKFAGNAFRPSEYYCIKATPVSAEEMKRALRQAAEAE